MLTSAVVANGLIWVAALFINHPTVGYPQSSMHTSRMTGGSWCGVELGNQDERLIAPVVVAEGTSSTRVREGDKYLGAGSSVTAGAVGCDDNSLHTVQMAVCVVERLGSLNVSLAERH
jgi:hypothetical protein